MQTARMPRTPRETITVVIGSPTPRNKGTRAAPFRSRRRRPRFTDVRLARKVRIHTLFLRFMQGRRNGLRDGGGRSNRSTLRGRGDRGRGHKARPGDSPKGLRRRRRKPTRELFGENRRGPTSGHRRRGRAPDRDRGSTRHGRRLDFRGDRPRTSGRRKRHGFNVHNSRRLGRYAVQLFCRLSDNGRETCHFAFSQDWLCRDRFRGTPPRNSCSATVTLDAVRCHLSSPR